MDILRTLENIDKRERSLEKYREFAKQLKLNPDLDVDDFDRSYDENKKVKYQQSQNMT